MTELYIPYIETSGKPFTNFAEVLQQGAADQMKHVLAAPWVMRGALMPDAHHGYTLPIGGVVGCKDMVSPAFVGYDIGCGMLAQKTNMQVEILEANKDDIRDTLFAAIPTGFSHQENNQPWPSYDRLEKTDWFNWAFHAKGGHRQIGTLGGGNHFIEVGIDTQQAVWFIIHSGSRNVGYTTATQYMSMAHPEGIPKEGVYGLSTDSDAGKDYIMDMNMCLEFALVNRQHMAANILRILQMFDEDTVAEPWFINRNHNHAEYNEELGLWIHRKGATHAEDKMLGVIPGNMRDGSFIVSGKGNPDSLFSSSHGAGRVLGRKEAKRKLDFKALQLDMEKSGVSVTLQDGMVDESPQAYKSIFEVMKLQKDLVEVVTHVQPKVVVKG